jgi:hypothetical protein
MASVLYKSRRGQRPKVLIPLLAVHRGYSRRGARVLGTPKILHDFASQRRSEGRE